VNEPTSDDVDLSDDGAWWLRNYNLTLSDDPLGWLVDRAQWVASGGIFLEGNQYVVENAVVPTAEAAASTAVAATETIASSTVGRYAFGLAVVAVFVGVGVVAWRRS